jgi:hypothetical protein
MGIAASPRPWTKNPAYPAPDHGEDPSPILDAKGADILRVSEWVGMSEADIDLIVSAVNELYK